MKENWTTDMKQKLEGHKMAPPAGLWEGISSEMGIQKELALKTVAIKRWQWVAAMFLALVGFFLVYQFSQDEPLPQVAHTSQKQEAPTTKEANPENQPLALADIPHRALTKVSPKTPVEVSQPSPVKTVQEVTEENAQQVSEETASQQVSEETSQQPSVVTSHRPHTEGHHQTANYHTRQTSVLSTDSQWSIGLNASGGLLAASSSSQRSIGQSDYPVSDEFNYNNFVDKVSSWPSTSSEVYDYEAKHRLPMSLGLSVYYQLNPSLAFQTGVNYTYLYSEFSTPLYPNIYREQKLHYLGVPVGLSWQFWKTSGFSFYLSGSAMLQKCLNEKPWQWSVNASAGAEYAITPLVGIYLQPSLGYYFHDGTSFEHYYKEHPLAPSIEFGLRLHLSGK
jgi:hypothetical protein